ncbi:MinD/ParA family ATP-binding protein [Mycolicibacterium palauense]|uniref:MinD/ParA family ATP-binding protein n=1 Tax=Mycolicibacterium palauense TaxID=2034511 RepID=UPI000BFF04A4|nr:MinD/ParA family protein [Mycolicibacterium palauense]
MAENVETGNGRHWSEPEGAEEPTQSAPSEPAAPPQELPGPPATSITPASTSEWGARPSVPPAPPAPPAPAGERGFNGERAASTSQPPWGAPATPTRATNGASQQPDQRFTNAGQQWGASPGQPWGQPSAAPQGQHQGPQMAPRRPQQPQAEQYQAPDVTQQIPVTSDQGRVRQAVPDREAATGRGVEADQYRRPSAPIQAASAGIRQDLIQTANEERTPVANTGWRGALNKSGFKLKPGKKESRRREVYKRIRAPKDSMYAVAVLTLKGGAGKTTVTATLGQVFSSIRADGVIAVDADPDAGDLPLRTAVHPRNLSMMEMLDTESNDLRQHDQVQRFLSTTETDLHVLANGWRPDGERVLVPEDIRDVYEIASHYYSMLLWDGDKALNSHVVREMLDKSNALALLVEASAPGAFKAGQAIDWLRNHGYEGLLARTVLVVNETTANTRLDMKALTTVLARQQLKLHHIPFDPHLDEGLSVDLDKLKKKTRRDFEDLAATLADDFSVPQPPAPVAVAS